MDENKLRACIADNLIEYRKQNGFTQLELAERLNYSDKSISKWERGDGVPDVFVLSALAELYGITVNDLLVDTEGLQPRPARKELSARSKLLITLLSVGLAWLLASIVFFILKLAAPELEGAWLTFIVAVPVSLIVAVVFACLWWGIIVQGIAVSLLVWSIAMALDVSLPIKNIVFIYVIAAVLQGLTVMWFLLKKQNRI